MAGVWYSLAFAVAMTLAGSILMRRGFTSVGISVLLPAAAGLAVVVCLIGLMVSQ